MAPTRTAVIGQRFRYFVIAAAALLFLLVTYAIYYFSSFVTGTELNTRTWDLRKFSFRRDPFTNYQLSGITHSSSYSTDPWTSYPTKLRCEVDPLIRKHLLNATNVVERWDLVSMDGNQVSSGDANILVNLLHTRDFKYDNFWSTWTADHPAKAAILWPAAQKLVSLDLYAKLPTLLETALLESTEDEFNTIVSKTMQRCLLEACQSMEANHQSQRAAEVAQVGLSYGDHPLLQRFLDPDLLDAASSDADRQTTGTDG